MSTRGPRMGRRRALDARPSRRASLPTGGVAALLLAVLLLGAFASARAEAARRRADPKRPPPGSIGVQNEDGGYGEKPGAESGQEMTGWAMLGLEAAGVNPQDVASGKGKSRRSNTCREQISTVQSPGDLARTILALEGAGIEPREFGGRNLVAALLAKRRPDGSYEDWPNSTAYAVLALRSAGIANVADSLEWLREAQNEDGGWGDVPGSPSNADGTGAVLQALSPSSKAAQRAVGYLRQVQQPGGGYRLGGNGALNTQSTAWAVEGLLAAGADPAQFKRGGKSAYEYLEDNQAGDGHYRYSSKSDQTPVWVTGQVLVAASKKYLPLEAAPRAAEAEDADSDPTPTPAPEPVPLPEPVTGGAAPAPTPTPVFPAKGAHGANSQGGKNGAVRAGSIGRGVGRKPVAWHLPPVRGVGVTARTAKAPAANSAARPPARPTKPSHPRSKVGPANTSPPASRRRSGSGIRFGLRQLRPRIDHRRPGRRLRALRPRLLPLPAPAEEPRPERDAPVGPCARRSVTGCPTTRPGSNAIRRIFVRRTTARRPRCATVRLAQSRPVTPRLALAAPRHTFLPPVRRPCTCPHQVGDK